MSDIGICPNLHSALDFNVKYKSDGRKTLYIRSIKHATLIKLKCMPCTDFIRGRKLRYLQYFAVRETKYYNTAVARKIRHLCDIMLNVKCQIFILDVFQAKILFFFLI